MELGIRLRQWSGNHDSRVGEGAFLALFWVSLVRKPSGLIGNCREILNELGVICKMLRRTLVIIIPRLLAGTCKGQNAALQHVFKRFCVECEVIFNS